VVAQPLAAKPTAITASRKRIDFTEFFMNQ
jgi:hypothetical protein